MFVNISIHLMLRFNIKHNKKSLQKKYFNTSYVTVQLYQSSKFSPLRRISIHLMLRFNSYGKSGLADWWRFQYILCYGSTLLVLIIIRGLTIFQYILCYGSTWTTGEDYGQEWISIHLMLRFNFFFSYI